MYTIFEIVDSFLGYGQFSELWKIFWIRNSFLNYRQVSCVMGKFVRDNNIRALITHVNDDIKACVGGLKHCKYEEIGARILGTDYLW